MLKDLWESFSEYCKATGRAMTVVLTGAGLFIWGALVPHIPGIGAWSWGAEYFQGGGLVVLILGQFLAFHHGRMRRLGLEQRLADLEGPGVTFDAEVLSLGDLRSHAGPQGGWAWEVHASFTILRSLPPFQVEVLMNEPLLASGQATVGTVGADGKKLTTVTLRHVQAAKGRFSFEKPLSLVSGKGFLRMKLSASEKVRLLRVDVSFP